MLTGLYVRNILLLDRLDLDLEEGLNVLTGETGAGKSILLTCLSLALGGRAEKALLRDPKVEGSVSASFSVPADHAAAGLLTDRGLADEDGEGSAHRSIVLRRRLTRDGRSKALINDQPTSIAALRDVGDALIEVHGQHDERGLLDARQHRALLDAFAGHDNQLLEVGEAFQAMRSQAEALSNLEKEAAEAATALEDIEEALKKLERLNPQPGEEAEIISERRLLQNAEKLIAEVQGAADALSEDKGLEAQLSRAAHRLAAASALAEGELDGLVAQIEQVLIEAAEARRQLSDLLARLDFEPERLESLDDRLYDLRALGRRFQMPTDQLPELHARLTERKQALAASPQALERARQAYAKAEARWETCANALHQSRKRSAEKLDRLIEAELTPLKLDRAKVRTEVVADLGTKSAGGFDKVQFTVQTNPGEAYGPLMKIASGGELSRFILALKVALSAQGEIITLIFDEIDRGVGGAVADAIGQRLAVLARHNQVLVVTHAPQVAARADHHLLIEKVIRLRKTGTGSEGEEAAETRVKALDGKEREREVARMLAGATVTPEAEAAAAKLISLSRQGE